MRNSLRRHLPLLTGVLLAAAFWPVGVWYVRRSLDGADEPWGLLALLVAVALVARAPRERRHAGWGLCLAAGLALAYAALFAHVPPLGRAILAVLAVSFVVSTHRLGRLLHLPTAGLLLLSLPVLSSLLFYAGYPLRRLVTLASMPLLRASGYAVEARGITLAWGDRLVAVDAPCSGVKMLWAAAFFTCVLASLYHLDARRTLGLGVFALVAVIVGNVLRATALFFVEAGVVEGPAILHPGIGVASFLLVGVAILAAAARREVPWRSASSS